MQRRAFDTGNGAVRLATACAATLILLLLGASAAQARISVSPNFRMNTPLIPGRGKDSVGMAVDPRNPRHIVEVNADWEVGQCEHHVSFDGGLTWTGGPFRAPAAFGAEPARWAHTSPNT